MSRIIATIALGIGILAGSSSSRAQAEPIGKWWSEAGMGDLEYGYNRGDGTELMLSCNPGDSDRLHLSVSIDGESPSDEYIVFDAGGEVIEFYAEDLGTIEMRSRVSINSLYVLFENLKRGRQLEIWFSPVSIHEGDTRLEGLAQSKRLARQRAAISLTGSAKALGPGLCGN